MTKSNPIQFAVVREDPEIETQLLQMTPYASQILLIGSGGCTGLSLRSRFPEIQICLMEPNPSQIELIQAKQKALAQLTPEERARAFSIGTEYPQAFTSCGNFESLFRSFRNFIYEFVLGQTGWISLFSEEQKKDAVLDLVFSNKYWGVAFELFFSDPILRAMFGPDAIQHAPPGSYASHFRRVLEAGLKSDSMNTNYFLHHIFLGYYLNSQNCLPAYLVESAVDRAKEFQFLPVFAQNSPNFSSYDLVSLSNIFDWMQEDQVKHVAQRITRELRTGSWVVFRQLNHAKEFRRFFGDEIQFDEALSQELFHKDRSLFYSKLSIGRKVV